MTKKSIVLTFIFLMLVSMFIGGVWAQTDSANVSFGEYIANSRYNEYNGTLTSLFSSDEGGLTGNLKKWILVWEEGDTTSLNSIVLKYLFLILIFILIFSILSYAKFPESASLQLFLALVISLLSTFAIDPGTLTGILRSYTALGVTLSLFVPILILGFFTIVVATKVNPIGILIQKILWVIYATYLFLSNGAALILGSENFYNTFIFKTFVFFGGMPVTNAQERFIAMILFVASIAIFIICVKGNDFLTQWNAHEMRKADLMKYKDTAQRSKASRETDAELTRS